MNTTNLDSIMDTVEQIPTLPIVSQQIMGLLGDEDVAIKKLVNLIEKDQALAVKILKVANSAFYGTLGKVSTIDHALVILGLKEVKAILLAFSVHNFFSADGDDDFDRGDFWKHAIICSHVAKYLARHFNIVDSETVFLSGLIHDMGKVVFDKYLHEEFMEVLQYVSSNNESFSQGEKEILGVTHYQVGAKLLQKWNFPQEVIMNVFYHHAPWHDSNYLSGSIVTCLANIFLVKVFRSPF